MIEGLIYPALKSGLTYTEFWTLTVREITDIIESCNKDLEEEIKSKIYMNYELAVNIVSFLGASLNGKNIPTFDKLYPNIHLNKNTTTNANLIKAQLLEFANGYNRKHKYKDD